MSLARPAHGGLLVRPRALAAVARELRWCSDELAAAAAAAQADLGRAGPLPAGLVGTTLSLLIAVLAALVAEADAVRDLADRLTAAAGDYEVHERAVASSLGD